MGQTLVPARGVPPGQILSLELEARGWTQRDLAEIIGRPPQVVNEIIRGTKQITPETALELGQAFGTSPEFWTNLEANYRLWLARRGEPTRVDEIARRSRLYSLAPVPELVRRRWIRPVKETDELEAEVCRFLGISSPDEPLSLAACFRHASERGPQQSAEIAWVRRVEQLARAQQVGPFNLRRLEQAVPGLLALSTRPDDIAGVPRLLTDLGIHFVVVPHLPQTYLDGAKLHLGDYPVVALTLRYDRIDSFWFSLLHELAHLICGHSGIILDTLEGAASRATGCEPAESEANDLASRWLVDQDALDRFVARAGPHFSRAAIESFAQSLGRHPGIVLGRLQHAGVVGYGHLRPLLAKVKPFLDPWIDSAGPAVQAG